MKPDRPSCLQLGDLLRGQLGGRRLLDEGAGDQEVLGLGAHDHVVVTELDGLSGAEVRAHGAEGAAGQVKGEGDFLVPVGQGLNGALHALGGAHPHTHPAVDAGFRVVDDAATVAGGCLGGLSLGELLGGGGAEQVAQSFGEVWNHA